MKDLFNNIFLAPEMAGGGDPVIPDNSGASVSSPEVGADNAGVEPVDGAGGTETTTYTREQVQEIIRKRLADEKRKVEPYQRLVTRLSQMTGMTPDQIEAYLDRAGYQQSPGVAPATPAAQQGYDPMTAQLQQVYQTAHTAGNVALETRRMLEEQNLKNNPLYADWDQVREDVRRYADRMGVTLEQAYWAVNGPSRAEALKKEAEQRALENARRKGGLTAEGDGAAEFQKLGITAEEARFAQATGLTPEEFAALKRAENLDDYMALKSKKKS